MATIQRQIFVDCWSKWCT